MVIDLNLTDSERERFQKQLEKLNKLASRSAQEAFRGSEFRRASAAFSQFVNSPSGQAMRQVRTAELRSFKGLGSTFANSVSNDVGKLMAETVLPELSTVLRAGVPSASKPQPERLVATTPLSIQRLGSLLVDTLDTTTESVEKASPSPEPGPPSPGVPDESEVNTPVEATTVDTGERRWAFSPGDLLLSLAIRLPQGIIDVASTLGPSGLIAITDGQTINLTIASVQSVLLAVHRIEELDGALKLLGAMSLGRPFFNGGNDR